MQDLIAGELTIATSKGAAGTIILTWRGKSNDRHPGAFLGPFLAQLADEAAAGAVGIELRFEQLEYFNSSTISAVVRLLQDLRQRKLQVRISYDGSIRSQQLSFQALKPLAALDDQLTVHDVSA